MAERRSSKLPSKLLTPLTLALVTWPVVAAAEGSVEVPLSEWTRVERSLATSREQATRAMEGRMVAVGETSYRGRLEGRNLRLQLLLRAHLGGPGTFKDVEVIGTDAVVLSAKRGGAPIPLISRGDRWVWTTNAAGPVELTVELVIPPRGPRGSIEYRFGIPESPVTQLVAFFPSADLSPKVTGAVTNQVRSVSGGTELTAVVAPARELHLVGFHDVDEAGSARDAKLYAESENLVSLSEDGVELFSVVGLTILYAPAKRFRIELPQGFELISADGQGAFQYSVEREGDRSILIGETAFGITQRYEISLRAKRALGPGESEVRLPIPRLLDVERDSGFVALEIPGKISVAGVEGEDLTSIDVRELPEAILRSSVSPVVRAFRYAGPRAGARIALARHPEKALAAGGADVLRATSVVTGDGRLMTDLSFTLRNNLQQYLALELPEGAEVRSAVLEGDPIKPSRDAEGRVLVPLRRSSSGPAGLQPFRVQLVYESAVGELGAIGRRHLALPRLLVPVASVEWSIYVPATYGAAWLAGEPERAHFARNADWHRASDGGWSEETDDESALFGDEGGEELAQGMIQLEEQDEPSEEESPAEAPAAGAHGRAERASGAMPVRVQVPRDGRALVAQRFWVDAGEHVGVQLLFARTPLPLAAQGAGILVVAALIALVLGRTRDATDKELPQSLGVAPRLGSLRLAIATLAGAAVLGATAGVDAVLAAAILGVAATLARRGRGLALAAAVGGHLRAAGDAWVEHTRARGRELLQELERRRKDVEPSGARARLPYGLGAAIAVAGGRAAWLCAKLVVLAILSSVLTYQLLRLIALLQNPL